MNQSRLSRVLGVLPLLGAMAFATGCNKGTTVEESDNGVAEAKQEQVAEPAAKDTAAKDTDRGDRHHRKHGRGPDHLLFAALHELDLSEAQRTTIKGEIDALREARGEMKDRAGFEAHRTAMAKAIRSGKIDEAALAMPAMNTKTPPDGARFAKAIQTLHDTLTADQRKQLVDAMSAKMEKHEGRMGPPGDMDKRFEKGGPLGHMMRDIEMTDAQREQINTALAKLAPPEVDREAMKARHEAFKQGMRERMAAFASDKFDAAAFTAPPKDAPMGGPEAGHGMMVKALATVVPLLTEAQRAELAARFEQGPPGGGPAHEDCGGK